MICNDPSAQEKMLLTYYPFRMSSEISFLDTIQTEIGVKNYVNKVFDVLDQTQWLTWDIVVDRLKKDELVLPVYAIQYQVNHPGKWKP